MVVGHRGEEVKKDLTGNPAVTATLEYIYEEDVTKAGIIKTLNQLSLTLAEPFFLAMADLVIEKNPYLIFNEIPFLESSLYTLVDRRKETNVASGALSQVHISRDGTVTAVGRSLSEYSALEVGIYYITIKALRNLLHLQGGSSLPSLDGLLNMLAGIKLLRPVFLEEGEWFDVNTPATHIKAELFARAKNSSVFLPARKKNLKLPALATSFTRPKKLSTDIFIEAGLLDRLAETKIIPDSYADAVHFLLTDTVVDLLHAERVLRGLHVSGYNVQKIVVPAGEISKSLSEYSRIADEVLSLGMDKRSILISLGGGVVNNIAGFLASTLYRGIGLIHIPTTTMAQVDAAIDFKQGINSSKGKNLFGSYYPATSIIIDPQVLSTLDERNLFNGISESIKHALTQDSDFLEYLLKERNNIKDVKVLECIVRKTINLKVPLLNGDVNNDFNEMIPQYGHSIGHAVERLSSYDLLHGEAIAIGMCLSAEIALLLGICTQEVVDLHYRAFEIYDLPVTVPSYMSSVDVVSAIRFDKHHVEKPFMAFVKDVGIMFSENGQYGIPVDYGILKRAIEINKKRHEK